MGHANGSLPQFYSSGSPSMSYTEALKRIGGVAHNMVAILDRMSHVPSIPSTTPLLQSDVKFELPTPHSPLPDLIVIGLDHAVASALTQVYTDSALLLRSKYEAEYTRFSSTLPLLTGSDHTKLQSKYLNALLSRYQHTLRTLETEVKRKAESKVRQLKTANLAKTPIFTSNIGHHPTHMQVIPKKNDIDPNQSEGISQNSLESDTSLSKVESNKSTNCLTNAAPPSYAFPTIYPPPKRDTHSVAKYLTRLPPLCLSSGGNRRSKPALDDIQTCIRLLSQLNVCKPLDSLDKDDPLEDVRYSTSVLKHHNASVSTNDKFRNQRVLGVTTSYPLSNLKLATKINPANCSLAPPILDTSTQVLFHTQSDSSSAEKLASNSSSYGLQKTNNGSRARKIAPLPRRIPRSRIGSPFMLAGDTSPSSSRTPSLSSDSGSESRSPSPLFMPITPPSSQLKLSSTYPDLILPPGDIYSTPVPGGEKQKITRGLSLQVESSQRMAG